MSHYAIRNVRADENMTDALHFVFLELGKKSELKAAKVEVEIISRASGLTVEEVEGL